MDIAKTEMNINAEINEKGKTNVDSLQKDYFVPKSSKISVKRRMRRYYQIYIMLIPVVAFFIIFCYAPMYGIVLAFKDYSIRKGILGSDWVGLKHFTTLFSQLQFQRAFWNTLKISAIRIVCTFPIPIIFAILINEMCYKKYKKTLQTIMYLPYFISWLVLGGLVKQILDSYGPINNLLNSIFNTRIAFLTESQYFLWILLISEIWKGTGWGTIIYVASMASISPEMYEAAEIDGCKRWGKIVKITLPSIAPTVTVMLILSIAGIMNAGFDPIFNLYNPLIYDVSDIIDTYAYRIGIADSQFDIGTAIGLFKSVINFALLLIANFIAKKLNGSGIYD